MIDLGQAQRRRESLLKWHELARTRWEGTSQGPASGSAPTLALLADEVLHISVDFEQATQPGELSNDNW